MLKRCTHVPGALACDAHHAPKVAPPNVNARQHAEPGPPSFCSRVQQSTWHFGCFIGMLTCVGGTKSMSKRPLLFSSVLASTLAFAGVAAAQQAPAANPHCPPGSWF